MCLGKSSHKLVLFLLVVFLNGCIDLGPKYKQPFLPFKIPEKYEAAAYRQCIFPKQYKWWRVFNDEEINKIVKLVIDNNLDLRKSYYRIREQLALALKAHGERFPTINGSFQVLKRRIPYGTSEIGGLGPFLPEAAIITSYDLGVAASFELDLWKRLEKEEEASKAAVFQSLQNYRAVLQTIVSEAILKYLKIWALSKRIELVKSQIRNYEITEKLLKRRYENGLVPLLEVKQVQQAKIETEARLPELIDEYGKAQYELSVLCGVYPTEKLISPPGEIIKPEPIPSGIPSDLLRQRPDILAAEANLKRLNAEVGIALANRFPRISLTGNLGYSSSELTNLTQPANQLWGISLGIVQPLFNAGRLKALQRAAEARYAQAIAQYAKTVLTAFQEVESALRTRKYLMKQKEKVTALIRTSEKTLRIALWRYQAGLIDYFQVLDAQRRLFVAKEKDILLDLAILSNRVAFHRALGGLWITEGKTR